MKVQQLLVNLLPPLSDIFVFLFPLQRWLGGDFINSFQCGWNASVTPGLLRKSNALHTTFSCSWNSPCGSDSTGAALPAQSLATNFYLLEEVNTSPLIVVTSGGIALEPSRELRKMKFY